MCSVSIDKRVRKPTQVSKGGRVGIASKDVLSRLVLAPGFRQ